MFRPKFLKDCNRWKAVIKQLRGIGIADAELLLKGKISGAAEQSLKDEHSDKGRFIQSKSTEIKTVDELLEYCGVDLEKYEVDRFVTNKWQSFQSTPDGPDKVDLFQIKVWLKKKEANAVDLLINVHERICKELEKKSPVVDLPQIKKKNPILLEPFLTDHHVGKLCFDGDSIIWDKDKAIGAYEEAISEIIDKSKGLNIERILLPTGNDLLNIDSSKNATFRDTPQMTGEKYYTLVADTEMLLHRTIKRLSEIAPVDIVMVKGNHDYSSIFHIGRSILAYFKNDSRVNVFPHTEARQYYKWNQIMIAMCHSHLVKADKMPQIMATEKPKMWGATKHREAHLGHLHHEQKKTFNVNQDTIRLNGCTVRILDTLCPSDIWHKGKGFISGQKRTQALAFSKDALECIMYSNGK